METNIVALIGELFSRAVTLEWVIVALPVSFVFSLFLGRWSHASFWALLAVVLHQPVHAVITTLRSGGQVAGADLMTVLQNQFTNPDFLVLAVEFVLYSFLIAVLYLQRIDMFRDSVVSHAD
jgi:hypothetical protein